MSVWPNTIPTAHRLVGSDGALVLISLSVDPRCLEALLEALAQVDFPINPQIYHDAAVIYDYPDGARRTESCTLVEFPAYSDGLPGLRSALEAYGFDPRSVTVAGILEEMHSEGRPEPAPEGADYIWRTRRKSAGLARTATLQ